MTSPKRFSSPYDCYAIFVGDTCPAREFLGGMSPEDAVKNYCDNDWPWDDEQPTEEIRAALLEYVSGED